MEQVFNNGFYYCYVVRCLKPHAPTFIYLAEKKKKKNLKTLTEIYILQNMTIISLFYK